MKSGVFEVAPNVWGLKDIMVNVYFIKTGESNEWVLVDTGMKTARKKIRNAAIELFGSGSAPTCIVLTHGHFDHVGSLEALVDEWKVKVYAHYLELPYLMGKADYQPGDPTVGGGLMASLASLYPTSPIDISEWVVPIPEECTIPELPGWRFYHTPGHAPGHVSLFREKDHVLIAGDAFVTTKQESIIAIAKQEKVTTGPPKYFTYDWEEAETSVNTLAGLKPRVAATGHGKPLFGDELTESLEYLLANFQELAVPKQGRYVDDPAVADASGFVYVPPKAQPKTSKWIIGAAIALSLAAVGMALVSANRKNAWFATT